MEGSRREHTSGISPLNANIASSPSMATNFGVYDIFNPLNNAFSPREHQQGLEEKTKKHKEGLGGNAQLLLVSDSYGASNQHNLSLFIHMVLMQYLPRYSSLPTPT